MPREPEHLPGHVNHIEQSGRIHRRPTSETGHLAGRSAVKGQTAAVDPLRYRPLFLQRKFIVEAHFAGRKSLL
jgi:hypothetical protein